MTTKICTEDTYKKRTNKLGKYEDPTSAGLGTFTSCFSCVIGDVLICQLTVSKVRYLYEVFHYSQFFLMYIQKSTITYYIFLKQ
jgi:hypothetical protein